MKSKWLKLLNSVIVLSVSLHILWGIGLQLSPESVGVTAIAHTAKYFRDNATATGLFLFVVGASAAASLKLKHLYWPSLVLVVPQQIVLLNSLWGSLWCAWHSMYADKTPHPGGFIFNDQGIHVWVGLFHTIAVLDLYVFSQFFKRGD